MDGFLAIFHHYPQMFLTFCFEKGVKAISFESVGPAGVKLIIRIKQNDAIFGGKVFVGCIILGFNL